MFQLKGNKKMLIINPISVTRPDPAPALSFKVMAQDFRGGMVNGAPTEPEAAVLHVYATDIESIRNSPFGKLVDTVTIITDDDSSYLYIEFKDGLLF